MTQTTTPAAPQGPPPRRVPRWLWALLVVSLAINLLIAGAMAGFAWRHGGWHRGGGGGFLTERLLSRLPEEKRSELRPVLEARAAEIEAAWRDAGAARRKAMDLFAADPFDRPAFEAAIGAMGDRSVAGRTALLAMLGEIGEKLTAEERRQVLRSLQRGFGRRHEGGP